VHDYGQAAVIRYEVHFEIDYDGEIDSDVMWFTHLHEFRDGRWQVVWSHATRIRR
jgi:hypothetical protein